ncbi:hypothetical protein [Paraliomyxa miuraensis]|uniref:hypothetical protein n=1 Tax=Paraliomyxa miuraensis TaxID=376150 RepID=UPI00225B7546|nr:hypothetical protein [Paraliomyxa miuraensis]MCX4244251.1 hypothetical protein [Paraliomyxa miuraensis]
MLARSLRPLLILSLSTALLAAGCNEPSEGKAPAAGEAKADGSAEATPGGETKTAETTPTPTGVTTTTAPADKGSLAAAVAEMAEVEVEYAAELDPLLDLVPAGSRAFMVVRDMGGLLAMADAAMNPLDTTLRTFASGIGGDASKDVALALEGYRSLTTSLRGPSFDASKGVVVADLEGEGVVIYGTSTPDALPTLLRALGASGDDMPDECKAVDGVAGYAVCAKDAVVLGKYAPGKGASGLRGSLATRLGVEDIDHANVLAHVAKDDDPKEQVTFAVATTPGLLHFTVGVASAPEELARALGKGSSPALGLAAPGSGFWWLKLDPSMIAEQAKSAPFPVRNVLGTLTGEVMMGTLPESGALVVLVGVTDPAPAGGLVALAGMQAAALPKELPDGTKLDIQTQSLDLGGKTTQVLHATVTPTAERAKEFSTLGLTPEAWLVAAGGYVAVVFGGGEEVAKTVANYTGSGMMPDGVRALPKPLAQGLVDGQVSMAMHVPLDGLQSPVVASSIDQIAEQIPAGDLPAGIDAHQMMRSAFGMISSMSGLSMWMGPPKDGLVFHLAVSTFGDPRTEEGKAALEAVAAVQGGADPAATYGALAERFKGSDHAFAYEARAGKNNAGVLMSVATLGVLAAVAVPAVVKYRDRSKLAGAMAAEPPVLELPE